MIVPAEYQLCAAQRQSSLRLLPSGQAHSLRDLTAHYVMVDHQHL
jgi:hypothetical protein